ncbi:MAG: hypothetical protein ABW061_28515 [Polyangiaceae bacterium]
MLLSGCYDTRLIPDDAVARGGSASHGGSSSAGEPEGGSLQSEAGAPDGDAAGSPPSGGSAGTNGQAGAGGTPRVTWLDLDGAAAPSSSATNSELGIEGVFSAYGDGCSQLVWDEAKRCASGRLCDPKQSIDNWGIAVGFEFHNTGLNGTPPNTQLIWDPRAVGALGLAWRITGTAPKVQVWVLNMAPSWHGQCNVMTCEINGPPDGVAPAPLSGELRFDDMDKDYWGGTGTQYTFDPAAVHALQFKIAAVQVGVTAFDFCIDSLGIIR